MRDIALVILVLGSAALAIRRPVYGMLLFVAFGIINPQGFTWGFGRSFPIAMIMAVATIIGYVLSPEPKRFPRQREVWMLLGLWGLFVVSTAVAYVPHRGWMSDAALTQFTHVSKIFVMIFLSMSIFYSAERVQMLMKVVALSIGLLAVKGGVFAILSGGNELVWGPEGSFLYANNAIGLAMAMNVPLLYYLIQLEPRSWLRKIMWVMLGLSVPAIVCTFSRGAWLGLMAGVGLILLKSKYKALIIGGGAMLAVSAVAFIPFLATLDLVPERVQTRFDELVNYEEEGSAVSRFWNWEACKRVGFANPLTGEGFDYYGKHIYVKYFPEFIAEYGHDKVWSCHSMWLTVLAEHGILAFLLWIALLVSCFLSLRKIQRFSSRVDDLQWMGYYASMVEISFVVYMIVGTFLDVAYFDVFYQFIVVVILLKEYMYSVVRSWHRSAEDERFRRSHVRASLAGTQ
ncbi:MAG: membrane protein [Nitrospirales bacterium]|nr:MAG: membrane protein [Nitrospirales bacterium]